MIKPMRNRRLLVAQVKLRYVKSQIFVISKDVFNNFSYIIIKFNFSND